MSPSCAAAAATSPSRRRRAEPRACRWPSTTAAGGCCPCARGAPSRRVRAAAPSSDGARCELDGTVRTRRQRVGSGSVAGGSSRARRALDRWCTWGHPVARRLVGTGSGPGWWRTRDRPCRSVVLRPRTRSCPRRSRTRGRPVRARLSLAPPVRHSCVAVRSDRRPDDHGSCPGAAALRAAGPPRCTSVGLAPRHRARPLQPAPARARARRRESSEAGRGCGRWRGRGRRLVEPVRRAAASDGRRAGTRVAQNRRASCCSVAARSRLRVGTGTTGRRRAGVTQVSPGVARLTGLHAAPTAPKPERTPPDPIGHLPRSEACGAAGWTAAPGATRPRCRAI